MARFVIMCILVTFAEDAGDHFVAFVDFKEALEALLGRPVDLAAAARADGFETLAITISHAHHAAVMNWDHRAPWNRILAAQARLEGCALVSVDRAFDTAGVERIW